MIDTWKMASFNLLGNFFNRSLPKVSNYLSLTLTKDKVLATIWSFEGENIQILGFAHKTFANVENLVHQAAIAIDSSAEQAKTDVQDVVYGLSANWFEDGKISKETASLLKKLSEDLELKAQAFVPLPAAINHFLKIEESITPHAVLIGILGEFCEVCEIKNNKIADTKTFDSRPNLEKIKDLIKQLKTEESLPSRIIIYGISQDAPIAQEIVSTTWQDLFKHEPRINFIDEAKLSKAVVYAQAADILGHDPVSSLMSHPQALSKDEKPPKDDQQSGTDEFGFIEGEDILEKETRVSESESRPLDLREEESEEKKPTFKKQDYALELDQKSQEPSATSQKESFTDEIATIGWLPKLIEIIKERSSLKKILFGLIILAVMILLGVFILGRTITKAEVIIKVNAKPQESNFIASVSTNGSADISKQQLAGEEIDAQSSGSQKAVTSGTKKIGNKAKGSVDIRNWNVQTKTFATGTEIITNDGLKFTIDNDVEVASRSAGPGINKVGATAEDVGPKYNISSNSTPLTIIGFDSTFYDAIVENAFTGGDEKQVSVVSQDDMDKLSKSLLESLSAKAKDELKAKVTGKKIADDTITIQVTKKQFDKNVDEEASLVNLDMEVTASTIAYDENTLKESLSQLAAKDALENLESKPQNIEILKVDTKVAKNGLSLSGKFRANLTPKFDEDQLKTKIAAKGQKEARAIIKEIPEVLDVDIKLSPNTFLFGSLPTDKAKIKFTFEVAK